MHNVVKEGFEIAEKDVTIRTVFSDMSLQVTRQTVHCEIVALILHTGTVIMDEGATNHWDKCVVAQATLNDTLSYNRAADMPFLSSFVNIELEELRTLVCTIVEFYTGIVYLERCLGDIPLHTGFPRHIPAALLIGSVQVFVGENLLVIIRISPLHALGFRSCCLAALVP